MNLFQSAAAARKPRTGSQPELSDGLSLAEKPLAVIELKPSGQALPKGVALQGLKAAWSAMCEFNDIDPDELHFQNFLASTRGREAKSIMLELNIFALNGAIAPKA